MTGFADQPGEVSPRLVIFDLDGVLTQKDTLTALIGRAVQRRPWLVLRLIGALTTVIRHGHDFPRRRAAVERIVGMLFAGVAQDELDRWCVRVGLRAVSSRAWARPALIAEYRRLQESGCPIVVATATEERVAAAVLETAGLRAREIVGSRIVSSEDGAALALYNYGPHKLRSIREAGYRLADAVFYTDSRSDLPTAAAAGRVVLVAPSSSTQAAYREAGVAAGVFGTE